MANEVQEACTDYLQSAGSIHGRFTAAVCALYFLVASTKILSFWKTGNGSFFESDLESGKELLTAIGLMTLLFCLYNLARKRRMVLILVSRAWPLMIVLAFAFASVFWSQIPSLTLKRYFKLLIFVVCLIDLITEPDSYRSLKTAFLWYIGAVIGVSFLVLILLPQYGWMLYVHSGKPVAKGIIAHKSELGEFCGASILVLLWIYYSTPNRAPVLRKQIWYCGVGALVLLLLTQGKNPLLNLLFSLLVFFIFCFIYKTEDKKLVGAAFCFSCSLVLVFIFFVMAGMVRDVGEFAVNAIGKDMTFTGRTDLWDKLIYFGFKQNPFLGSGYGAFFGGSKTSWLLEYVWGSAASAHCGYLQLFLETGIIGLLLFLGFLGKTLISTMVSRHIGSYREQAILVSIISFNLFYNIMSVSFFLYRMSFIALIFVSLYLSSKKMKSDVLI